MGIDGVNGAGGSQSQDYLFPKRDGVGYEHFNIKESLFTKLDTDKSGTISDDELVKFFNSNENIKNTNEFRRFKQVLFFSERTVNKFFITDINYDGKTSGLEQERSQFAQMYRQTVPRVLKDYFPNVEHPSGYDLKTWGDNWVRDTYPGRGQIALAKKHGVDLTDEQVQLLYDASLIQMNKWLFKDLSLYETTSNTSYTRLVTDEETSSCCGGGISAPPIGSQVTACPRKEVSNFEEMEENPFAEIKSLYDANNITEHTIFRSIGNVGYNNDYEVKNRLAWATFDTKSEAEVRVMTQRQYAEYQAEWQKVRDMSAADYRELLKPENAQKRADFEKTSLMTVDQIVQYIDIVEEVCQVDYDSKGWQMTSTQFKDVCARVNGNTQDENILTGKTRADIPPERLPLLKYLEDNGLLLDQFKESDDLDDMDI